MLIKPFHFIVVSKMEEAAKYFNRNEFIVNNKIDRDLQAVLRPLNLMQIVILQFKYRIRDNLIKQNGTFYNALLFCSTVVLTAGHVFSCVMDAIDFKYDMFSYLSVFETFDLCFYSFGIIVNGINNYCRRNTNVELVLKIQAVHNITKYFKNTYYRLSIWNWIYVIFLIIYIVSFTIYYCISIEFWTTDVLILSCFDMNIIYATQTIILLKNELILWTSQIKQFSESYNPLQHEDNVKSFCCQMHRAHLNILEAFNIFKKNFQLMITFHTIDTFVHGLQYIQTILYLQNINGSYFQMLSPISGLIITWILKNLSLQFILGLACENFYLALECSQTVCKSLFDQCAERRKLCKNICRAHDAGFSKLSGCGMFAVDATLPLQLLGALTSYTVVLLQFAFL